MKNIYYSRIISFVFAILLFNSSQITAQGFLHTSGKKILDGNGTEILLRGMGLGGWLVPEGYMLQTSGFANSPSEIKAKIDALVGTANSDQFYKTYRQNFVTRQDIQQMKNWGFNSLRLPLHYNLLTPKGQPDVFLEEGFAYIDSTLQWCKENHIYLILDLHCAPGGQNSANISDYNAAYPSLWQDEANKTQTIALWKKMAERYANETWIGGYDLLNETVWDFGATSNKPLRDLFIAITSAIRTVDKNHIVYIEGNNWATDFTGLTPAWDNNLVYSFHKYWNGNDQGSIQSYLTVRDQSNCPLWLGESGENSNQWYADCIALLEANNIGWSWWTLKKLESTSGLYSIYKPAEFARLLNYWGGTATQPTVAYAVDALNKLNKNLISTTCYKNVGVTDALFRQPGNTATIPYINNVIPGIIYAVNYDMGQNNYAYKDVDFQNLGSQSYNSGGQLRNDGVDIETCNDFPSNGYDVGWISAGEFLTFTTTIQQAGIYKIGFRVASNATTGRIIVRCDGNMIGSFVSVPNTGGWQSWKTVSVDGFTLPQGVHQITASFLAAGFNLNYMEFTLVQAQGIKENLAKRSFNLNQNFPNPFNGQTEISFTLPENQEVTLSVYNALGQKVCDLINNEYLTKGDHTNNWDSGHNPSGIYIYTLKTKSSVVSKVMTLLK